MSVSKLSASTQNYLKAIWAAQEWSDEPVTPSVLAAKSGVRLSSASDAIRKLVEQGLVDHQPYGDVMLTPEGEKFAVEMVRRHRLLETFLVEVLNYTWDEVHVEADALEHAVSDLLIDRMDDYLGRPERDPHGDPIPRQDGTVDRLDVAQLADLASGDSGRVERISDDDSEMLQFFDSQGIKIGAYVRIAESVPYSGAQHITICGHEDSVALGQEAARAVWVSKRKPEQVAE